MNSQTQEYPLTILEHHLDTFGHVNNAVYLQIFEEARWHIVTERGYGLDFVRQTGIGPTILEINLKFKRELRLRQKVVIRTRLASLEGKTHTLQQQIINEAGETCCEAEFKLALFDLKARKIVAPTAEWLAVFGIS